MDLNTIEFKSHQYIAKPDLVCILIVVTVENSDKLMYLFKYCTAKFSFHSTMKIPAAGTGAVNTSVQTIIKVNHWNTNRSDYKNLLMHFHCLTLNQVCAFSV